MHTGTGIVSFQNSKPTNKLTLMRNFTLSLIFLAVGISFQSYGQNKWVGITSGNPVGADIHLIESNIQQTNIKFNVNGYFENDIRTPRGTEKVISFQNGVQITEKGMPDLAKLYTNIVIPDLYNTEIKIISSKYEEFNNVAVAPSKGHFSRNINPEDVPFTYGDAYNEDAFWPGDLARLEDPFILRDFRGQTITIYPLQYNPATQTLRVYTDIEVEIASTTETGVTEFMRKSDFVNIEKDFGMIYNRFFLNMSSTDKSYQLLEGEEGSMLIIAHDDFLEAMQPFVNWKRTTGRKTEIVGKSEVGTTATAIKAFVQQYYNDNPDFTHLLLVGDAPQIPPMTTSSGHSDNAYGFLTGNDSYNELFVGRFSSEAVAHVETQVERMIHYERDINETDTWLETALGLAKNEGTGNGHNGGENDYVHMNFIRDTLLNYTYTEVKQRYDGNVPGIPNTNAGIISADINKGVGAINFCNHGSEYGWSVANYGISHVNQLTNTNKLPFIWSVACVNGAFVNSFSFAESWMRATHDDQPAGAIGTMMSTINQPWQPPMTGQDEMVALLTEQSTAGQQTLQRTFGGLSGNGSMAMLPAHGASGKETHETWVLFGDPTLKIRTATPAPMLVNYDPVILIGSNAFEVMVEDAEGATVAITRFDETEQEVIIIGTAKVENGMATINFDIVPNEPGYLTLTIMGFNKVTYINEELQVIPPDGPYVINDYVMLDDSEANNNNQADYGETIHLNVSLKNVGIEKADSVFAVLNTENEHVRIIQNEKYWGEIGEGGNMMLEGAFTIEVNQSIPDNHTVMFSLAIRGQNQEGTEKEWSSNFPVKIFSPVFEISPYVISDSQGNDNGLIEPGETIKLSVAYNNVGGAPAMKPITTLQLASPYILTDDLTHENEIIPAGQTKIRNYTLQFHEAIVEGTVFDIVLSVEDAQLVESSQSLLVGQLAETRLGEGTSESVQYPFYNYYQANRTQMIYTAEELGSEEKTITEIGFNIIQASTQHNSLPGFTIRMMHTDKNSLSTFVNTSEADTIFYADTYKMPAVTGWHNWEIKPFEYNGTSNILIEIVWGLLPQWANQYYKVATTNTGSKLTAYGYNDNQAIPAFNGTTSLRPNLYVKFEPEETAPSQLVEISLKSHNNKPIPGAGFKLGSVDLVANDEGIIHIDLQPGNYKASARAESHLPVNSHNMEVFMPTENIEESDEAIPTNFIDIFLTRLFNANFIVTDYYGNDVTDAVIRINSHAFDPGNYSFEKLMPGNYNYAVVREGYFSYTGQMNLNTDDALVEVMLMPDGTNISDLNENNIKVYPNPFKDLLYIENNTEAKYDIFVMDMLGSVVYQKSEIIGSATLDLNPLPTGHYLLKFVSDQKTNVIKISRMR